MSKRKSSRWMRYLRNRSRADWFHAMYVATILVLVGIAGYGLQRAFVFAQTTEALALSNIQVTGERRVTASEILASAGYTPGTNTLGVSLREIREAVEKIHWVRHATVRRVWPNELVITVVEREQVALARIDGEIYQVDIDGAILAVDVWTNTNFPILDGLSMRGSQDGGNGNAFKVGIYLDIIEVLGGTSLSEVFISESGDVSVVPVDDPLIVDLGKTDHWNRWDLYQRLKPLIREDFPTALRIDLRFKDPVITQPENTDENGPVETIIWGDETKLL